MPFKLDLPQALRNAGWKVVIHDAEGPEEPHATIYKKLKKWRVSLRTKKFLEQHHKWSQIDKNLKQEIDANWEALRNAWDELHGEHNPISSEENDSDASPDVENTK